MRRSILILVLLAGCLSEVTDEPEGPVLDWAQLALVSGHDHTDPALHQATTPNFVPSGFEPMISEHYGQTAGGYLCGDTAQVGGRTLAAVESRSDVGFALVDVTDPAAPEWLGELVMENTYVYDLAVVQDGKHVVLATAHTKGPELPGPVGAPGATDMAARTQADPAMRWNACGAASEDPIPREASLVLIDISDPTDLQVVSHVRLLGNGHSAFTIDMDGRDIIMATTLGGTGSYIQLFEVIDVAGRGSLVPLSTYKAEEADVDKLQTTSWHDGWIEEHPTRGWLMHAVGAHHYHVVDVNDPSQPEYLGGWSDAAPGSAGWTGNLHGVIPLYGFHGMDVAVVGPEWGGHPEDHPTGIIRVLDITDLEDIHEIGAWTLPYDVVWDDGATYQFSNHYYAIEDETMFVSMYHGGIWAVDLAPLAAGDWVDLDSIGVWQTTADVDSEIVFRWAPTNEEVFAFDGTIVTFDSNTGLHTARWTGEAMPAPEPWPVAPLFQRH